MENVDFEFTEQLKDNLHAIESCASLLKWSEFFLRLVSVAKLAKCVQLRLLLAKTT